MRSVPKADLKKLLALHESGKLCGVFETSNEDYHLAPGISKSSIDDFLVSPATFKYLRANPEPATSPMEFGSALHTIILEPQLFEARYVAAPAELDRRGTKAWKEIEEANPGKIVLKDADVETLRAMSKAARAHTRSALLEGLKELSFFWKCPTTGLLCKCRPDNITMKGAVVDLKSTTLAYPKRVWAAELFRRGYHRQGPMILDGIEQALRQANQLDLLPVLPKSFILFAQEKTAPYLAKPWLVGASTMALGRREYQQALVDIAACEKAKSWPGYPEKIEEIEAPEYAWRAEQEQMGSFDPEGDV